MPEISTVKNAVQAVVDKNRLLNAIFAGGKSLVASFFKTFYALWLEVTGLVLAMFTVMGGAALFRQYRADHFHDHARLLTVGAFTAVCGWFTLVSFVRARRTRR